MATEPNEIDLNEPIKLLPDLSTNQPFRYKQSKERLPAIQQQIAELRDQLDELIWLVTREKSTTPLQKAYWELLKKEKVHVEDGVFHLLDYKLAITKENNSFKDAQASLYALLRLRIAQKVKEDLAAEKIAVELAQILALYRAEGDLDVPITLEGIDLRAVPDKFSKLRGWDLDPFVGALRSFFVDGGESNPDFRPFVAGCKSLIVDRAETLEKLAKERVDGFNAAQWLQSYKEGAMTLYLLRLGGLDIYQSGVWKPTAGSSPPLSLFAYRAARHRFFIDPTRTFTAEWDKARTRYRGITQVSEEKLAAGKVSENGLVMTVHPRRGGGEFDHHVIPIDPVEFVSVVVRESVATLEALRWMPMINGGKRFDPPLPPSVAYIRYHAGDIMFLLIVLDLLDVILLSKSRPSSVASERPLIYKLRDSLKEYKRPKNREVWQVLEDYRSKSPKDDFLRNPDVRRQKVHSDAVRRDSMSSSAPKEPIGSEEKKHVLDLNERGHMESASPLLDAMTRGRLWEVFERVMVAHIGKDGKPWLAHSHSLIRQFSPAGTNVLHFHYALHGFLSALEKAKDR